MVRALSIAEVPHLTLLSRFTTDRQYPVARHVTIGCLTAQEPPLRAFSMAKVKPRLLSASCSATDKAFQRFAVRTALTHLPSSKSSQKLPLQQQRWGCAKVLARVEGRCSLVLCIMMQLHAIRHTRRYVS